MNKLQEKELIEQIHKRQKELRRDMEAIAILDAIERRTFAGRIRQYGRTIVQRLF